jgi:hypothetical protein
MSAEKLVRLLKPQQALVTIPWNEDDDDVVSYGIDTSDLLHVLYTPILHNASPDRQFKKSFLYLLEKNLFHLSY